jgi:signal transduction histidine kinase
MKDKPLVLVIDDSPVNQIMLVNILKLNNFSVVSAGSGEKGFEIAKESPPDLILLDIAMPGWNGYETCQRMKQDASLKKIPILFLSALDETENKVRALQVGGVDYINKPFQKEELLARVQTHLELAHLRQNLERDVANQTEKIQSLLEALQLSYEKAQQASILKTEFLRNISHEFLTPLAIIKGMTEILIEDSMLTEEQQKCAEAVMKASQQLNILITNALTFAEQFRGEHELVICDFYIPEVVARVLKKLSANLQAKDLQVTIEIAHSLQRLLRGNPDGIEKVLSKLVDNAIKFTAQGEIVIRVQPVEQCDDKRQWILFEVSDTGIGIAKEKQAKLFDIFYQVDGSSTRLYEGMGLGLAVAKMFTEKMGGQIGVESVLDKGSTFWFKVLV